jgi:selenocysteine lyase/cysteine desulfurase
VCLCFSGLGARQPHEIAQAGCPKAQKIFKLGYEHHSNELPWLESIAEVVEIGLDARSGIDLEDLEAKARAYADRPLRIGSFSAASNVTGILTDVRAVARAPALLCGPISRRIARS